MCLGGAIGSGARYLVAVWMAGRHAFPWSTLIVNALGSLLLGAVMYAASRKLPEEWFLFLGTGIMGGFTTYSTFNWETLQLAQRGAYGQALLYVAATLTVCLAAGAVGALVARSVL